MYIKQVRMRNWLIILSFLYVNLIFGQDETPLLHIDSFYENKSEYLIHTKKITFDDSIGKAQLIQRIKNWSGTDFVNPKEVLVNETNDQLVYNYIQIVDFGYGSSSKYYIRLIISIKEDKVRLQFYDDANVFYTDGSITMTARTYYLKNFFTKGNGLYPRKMFNNGLINYKLKVISTGVSLENYIKNSKNHSAPQKDDW
jgi:hypothetical protein